MKYLFGEINSKRGQLRGEFKPGCIFPISRKSDSEFHLSSKVEQCAFPRVPTGIIFMAFVYMNVPPVFKTCMGEVDLDGNGRILKELCHEIQSN